MPFATILGSLFGGATQEAHAIKQERFEKEKLQMAMTSSMLQDVMHNEYAPAELKEQAFNAHKDFLMEHLFPDQFKGDKKNPVRKMVDQFVGQADTGQTGMQALQ